MRVVATEEHIVTPEVVAAWRRLDPRWQDVRIEDSTEGRSGAALLELGESRIAAMDSAGIDVSVLSLTTPGVQSLAADEAVRLQTQVNDLLAATVRATPDRFQAFAMLATPDPVAAAKELERAVTRLGMVAGIPRLPNASSLPRDVCAAAAGESNGDAPSNKAGP